MIHLARHCGLSLLLAFFLSACGGGVPLRRRSRRLHRHPARFRTAPRNVHARHSHRDAEPDGDRHVASYGVAPALPAELALDTTARHFRNADGRGAAAAYTITAGNSTGSTTAVLSITLRHRAPAVSYSPTNTFTTSFR